MKTSRITLTLASLVLAGGFLFTSCKKKTTEDRDSSAASDNNLAEGTSNDIITIGAQGIDNTGNTLSTYRNDGSNQMLALSCASSITLDTVTKKLTVTFGGTPCADGRIRSGSLIYDYSQTANGAKHYRDPGFKLIVTSNNYKVDGHSILINNKTITNTTAVGFNPATTNLTWSIVSDITITKSNGDVVTWKCTRNKELLNTNNNTVYQGANSPIVWSKAKISITGNASGITAAGNSYTATITSPLVRDFTCAPDATRPHKHPFIQGAFDFTPNGKQTRHVDYGNGTCDLNATVTIGSWTTSITL